MRSSLATLQNSEIVSSNSQLPYRSGWLKEHSLLATTAVQVLNGLQRQQVRHLADYLQVFLNAARSASLSQALLKSICNTFHGLQIALPPVSQEQQAHDNWHLLCAFTLQLMLQHTITQSLPQTQTFHRCPDFNADLPNHRRHSIEHNASVLHCDLVQLLISVLHSLNCITSAQTKSLLDTLEHPVTSSQLPSADDAAYLDVSQLQVRSESPCGNAFQFAFFGAQQTPTSCVMCEASSFIACLMLNCCHSNNHGDCALSNHYCIAVCVFC